MKRMFQYGLAVLMILFLLWVGISFIDINEHNSPVQDDYKHYAEWNIFLQ